METVHVDLGSRSYPIFIATGLLQEPSSWSGCFAGQQILIVTNETIAPLYLDSLIDSMATFQTPPAKIETLVLPDGEQYKNLPTLDLIFDALLQKRFDRTATLVALGGGVIGDMVGFAAASYQRGVKFIQIPTTILSQVDSSVGGKTAVNHKLGKNMIGAFYQPKCVIIDLDFLTSLPKREVAAGLAEVIKYGLIYDKGFFEWIEANADAIFDGSLHELSYAIKRSCQIKAEVVAKDETEIGLRAILNLGHTYGHAIEAGLGYGRWLHGEAVAVGMVMACDLSVKLGWLGQSWLGRLKDLLKKFDLPTQCPSDMTPEMFRQGMSVDKKVSEGVLRLVLLKDCGQAIMSSDFDTELLNNQLKEFCHSD